MKTIYTTLFTILFSITILQAQTTIPPTDDLTVHQGDCAPVSGDPSVEILMLANTSGCGGGCYDDILMKFDLASFSGETVGNVTLNLHHFWHNPPGGTTYSKVYAITEDWDETTWDNAIDIEHGSTVYATPSFPVLAINEAGDAYIPEWRSIDITDLVNDWLSGAIENKGLVIIANTGSKPAVFASKNHGNTASHPYLEFDITTSVEDITAISDFAIYPNPATDIVNIKFNTNKKLDVNIAITNSNGQEVKNITSINTINGEFNTSISTEKLPMGVYFITINTNEQTIVKKLFIN